MPRAVATSSFNQLKTKSRVLKTRNLAPCNSVASPEIAWKDEYAMFDAQSHFGRHRTNVRLLAAPRDAMASRNNNSFGVDGFTVDHNRYYSEAKSC